MAQKVTVIGAGRMGSAMAATLFNKGFETIVWNRTASKTEPLARFGIRVAQSVLEAVSESDVVIVVVNDHKSSSQLLRQADIETALRGKVLVQLSTGMPDEARQMESWARHCVIGYLDGAIISAPNMIGTPQGAILYAGPEEVFNLVKPVLKALGENARLVGTEIAQARTLELALVSALTISVIFGFLQGYMICEAENASVERYVEIVKSIMPGSKSIFRVYEKLRQKDYAGDQASLEAWSGALKEVIRWCEDHGADHRIADAQYSIFKDALAAGKGQADIAYLYEVLNEGSASSVS